ncbi:MAG: hypothetical protein ACO3F3_01565, partial [Gemmataceae bacterium]
MRKLLATQKAFQEGGDHLRKGNFQAAVFILESQMNDIDGNKEYLDLLKQAYQGYLRDLHAKGLTQETIRYQKRLDIMEQSQLPSTSSALISNVIASIKAAPKSSNEATLVPSSSKVRGKVEDMPEDNLFSFTNSQKYIDARARLDQAEKEFASKNYKLASRLYEEAHRLEPRAMPQAVERWAYSRLYTVVESMNQNASSVSDPNWEKEIRASLQMSPKL